MRPQHHVGSAFDLLKYNFISPSRPPTFIHASLRKLRQTFRSSEARRLERATGAILRRHPPIIIVNRGALEKEDGSWRVSAIPYMGRLPGAFYPPFQHTHTHTSRLALCPIAPCPSPHPHCPGTAATHGHTSMYIGVYVVSDHGIDTLGDSMLGTRIP